MRNKTGIKMNRCSDYPNNTVAIILPVYKGDKAEYLSQSVNSLLQQSYCNLKIYIGVDGPISSELRDTLESITDERVRLTYFEQNRGLAIVLNDMISIANKDGFDYLARMDADDISMPDRIFKQVSYLEYNRDIDVVGGSIEEIDEKGNSRNKIIIYPRTPIECRRFFSKRNPHAHPAVMFRKSFFEKIGYAYRPEYRQNQDTMLWFDGFSHGTNNANIEDVILRFRMTDSLFKKRRNGWEFAKKQFHDRLMINRTLGYGIGADIFGFAMFCLLISPTGLRKLAYKIFR